MMLKKLRSNAFAMNSLVLFSGTLGVNFLGYLFHLITGRMVSPKIYGEMEALNSLMIIISVPALALSMLTTKFSAQAKAEKSYSEASQLFFFLSKKVIVYGLPVFILALLLTPLVASFMKIEGIFPFFLVWIIMYLSFLSAVSTGTLGGWQKFGNISWTGMVGGLVKILAAILFIKAGFALNGLIGSFILAITATYLGTIWCLRFLRREGKEITTDNFLGDLKLNNIKKFILPALLGNLVLNIFGNADMVLAKHNLNPIAAGQYGALTIVSKIIFFITGTLAAVLFSMSSESNHLQKKSHHLLWQALTLTLVLCTISTAIYFLFPQLVMGLLFGNRYASVSPYIGMFAIMVSLFSMLNLIIQYLLSINETSFINIFLLLAAIFVILILFVGQTIFAILGLMASAQLIALILSLFYLKKAFKNNE